MSRMFHRKKKKNKSSLQREILQMIISQWDQSHRERREIIRIKIKNLFLLVRINKCCRLLEIPRRKCKEISHLEKCWLKMRVCRTLEEGENNKIKKTMIKLVRINKMKISAVAEVRMLASNRNRKETIIVNCRQQQLLKIKTTNGKNLLRRNLRHLQRKKKWYLNLQMNNRKKKYLKNKLTLCRIRQIKQGIS